MFTILQTGKQTQHGEKIRIGDILSGTPYHHCLVCINTKYPNMGKYIAVGADYCKSGDTYVIRKSHVYKLDDIINTYVDLKVVCNMVVQ